jgi:hypothetical protein
MDSAAGPLVYALDVPVKTQGLYKAGTLNPVGHPAAAVAKE